jgi:ribosomal protein L37AE/L43A
MTLQEAILDYKHNSECRFCSEDTRNHEIGDFKRCSEGSLMHGGNGYDNYTNIHSEWQFCVKSYSKVVFIGGFSYCPVCGRKLDERILFNGWEVGK